MRYMIAFLVAYACLSLWLSNCVAQQQVYIPQQVGQIRHRIEYPTPLRDLFFGRYRSTPVYQYVPYRIVTPPPRPVYVQPPSYLVPVRPYIGGR